MARVKRGKRYASPADLTYRKALVRIIARAEATASALILERYPAWLSDMQESIRSDAPTPTLGATIDGVLLRISPLKTQASDASREQATRVNVKNQSQANETAEKLIGVQPFKSEPVFQGIISDFADANAALIKNIADTAVTQLGPIVRDGLVNGTSTKNMAKLISEKFKVSESRALFLARDQTASLNAQLSQVRMRSAGIEQYEWSTINDARVREEHVAREGSIFSWSSPPEGGHPGEDYNCRCVAIPIFEETD